MGELLPLCCGVILGLSIAASGVAASAWTAVIAAVPLGLAASWINGEFGVSAWLVLFDVCQVIAACAATVVIVHRLGARRGMWR
jgi:hypothetical protein